tara:strand:+ start:1392 stop:1943 length:552 start_codon:yes stop_codon:yes gene_type:complete
MKIKLFNKIALISITTSLIIGGFYVAFNKRLRYRLMSKKVKDQLSNDAIKKLDPKIKGIVKAFINKAEKDYNITLRIVPKGGLRTCDEQTALYNQGRTTSGNIVTNAKCGYSWHNFGLAIDVVEIKNNVALWENKNWELIGNLGKQFGFEWGGDWVSFKDLPHFQYSKGNTLEELRKKYNYNN